MGREKEREEVEEHREERGRNRRGESNESGKGGGRRDVKASFGRDESFCETVHV